ESISVSMNTDFPSANTTISEYETQYGVGIMTSSPGLINVKITFERDCLAPVETTICEGSYVKPFSFFNLLTIAWRNSGYPGTGERSEERRVGKREDVNQ